MMPGSQKQCLYRNAFITYDYDNDKFTYSPEVSDLFDVQFDDKPLWQIIDEDCISSAGTGNTVRETIRDLIADDSQTIVVRELSMRSADDYRKYNILQKHAE